MGFVEHPRKSGRDDAVSVGAVRAGDVELKAQEQSSNPAIQQSVQQATGIGTGLYVVRCVVSDATILRIHRGDGLAKRDRSMQKEISKIAVGG